MAVAARGRAPDSFNRGGERLGSAPDSSNRGGASPPGGWRVVLEPPSSLVATELVFFVQLPRLATREEILPLP
jgi:hypothetical protein